MFYKPSKGVICYDDYNLIDLDKNVLREQCGVVMQDGYLFNSSVAENIAMNVEHIDVEKVNRALKIACLDEFINGLPQKHNTVLGSGGLELSGGQRQRLFIARAVYNEPRMVFFDEATNSLDSSTELQIMNNLTKFLEGKTAIIIAHRLSTVKKADQIIVLERGSIIEKGNHISLTKERGKYYHLVIDQLELGN